MAFQIELAELYPGSLYFEGGERAILLNHAYTGTPNDVLVLGRYLNRHGYTVLLPMFSGHGTDRPEDVLEASPGDWFNETTENIRFLQAQGFEQMAVFGLSLGGLYAVSVLENFPDVFLGGGSFCSALVPKADTQILKNFMIRSEHLLKKAEIKGLEKEQRLNKIKPMLEEQLMEMHEFTEHVYSKLGRIKQPTLLVQAGRDQMIDPQVVYQAEKELTQADAQVKWYPESGHVITIGPERQQFQEDVLTFVNQLPWDN